MGCCDTIAGGGPPSPPAATACEAVVSPTGNSALDSTLIQTALDGPQQTVCLRGGTFVLQFGVVVPAGKLLKGANAILQRQPQVSTTTATALVSGVTTVFVVAAAAGLKIGDDLGFDGGGGNISATTSRITNIVGNTITVSPAVTITDAGPTTVYTTSYLVNLRDDCRCEGLMFDGNEPNNPIGRWQTTGSIALGDNIGVATADRAHVTDCRVLNEAGEGMLAGGDDTLIEHFVVDICNGNGIHFGGAHRCAVHDCHFNQTNQDVSVGHADGCVTFSNDCLDIIISDCSFRNSPLTGVASQDSPDNGHIEILGCHFEDIVTNAIEGIHPVDNGSENSIIANNHFHNCGPIEISNTAPSVTNFVRRWVVNGNSLTNTRIVLSNVRQCLVSNNVMRNADDTSVAVNILGCFEIDVIGNVIEDGLIGIDIQQAAGPVDPRDINIVGNTVTNAHSIAIRVGVAPTGSILIASNKIIMNDVLAATAFGIEVNSAVTGDFVAIVGNSVEMAGAAATRIGIRSNSTTARTSILSNHVRNANTGANGRGIVTPGPANIKNNTVFAAAGICIEVTGAVQPIVQGNTTYRGAGAASAIVIATAGSTAYVINNQYQGVFTDNSGGTAILRDNDALP